MICGVINVELGCVAIPSDYTNILKSTEFSALIYVYTTPTHVTLPAPHISCPDLFISVALSLYPPRWKRSTGSRYSLCYSLTLLFVSLYFIVFIISVFIN